MLGALFLCSCQAASHPPIGRVGFIDADDIAERLLAPCLKINPGAVILP